MGQLGGWLEPGQEGVVLCPEADGLPGDFVRTLRLRRWVFELGGRLEPGQEGVVLHQEADGLPRVRAIRLRRGVFKLGGWMECRQEGVVLHQQEDGVQGVAWRLSIPRPILTCTIAMLDTTTACTVWWSLDLHRRSITAARTSTKVVRARSRSEKAAGVRSRIEAASDTYVHN